MTPQPDAPVTVRDLHVRYGRDGGGVHAVRGIALDVAAGEVYALLGHNGAGKTSTVEVLEGHRHAASGHVRVLGHDPATAGRELRDRIGIVLQASSIERALTVGEALRFYGSVYSRPRSVGELLDLVGLAGKSDVRIGTLSGGQQRRLDLALGIIGSPDLLFLDEPTTGFDPAARRQAWELVRHLCDGGMTVLLTTHYMDEAEQLAHRVGVMAAGQLVAEGTPEQLRARVPEATITFRRPPGVALDDLALPPGAVVADDGTVTIDTAEPTRVLAAITGGAARHDVELEALTVRRPTLEDVFLRLSGEQAAGQIDEEQP
ncbi:MAG TPA: ABC transporter ATP-binding protein [Ilumatobacter sp.]|nr:ABC transporter ATP-binding protein [Ilumatobacter sp.]